jgi:hypothetical protein
MSTLVIQTSSTYDSFTQVTSLDGSTFELRFRWSDRAAAWTLDVLTEDGEAIALGLRIVVSWPLLRRVVHPRRPAGELMAVASAGGGDPGRNDLGARVVLKYIEAATVEELREAT